MGKWLDPKLFVLIISCTAFILGFSQLSSFGYNAFFKQDNKAYSNGTAIGLVSLADMTHEQAEQALLNKIKEWNENSSYILQYENKTTQLSVTIFQIDYQTSLEQVADGQQAELIVSLDEPLLEEAIRVLVSEEIYKNINIEKLSSDLVNSVKTLQQNAMNFQLIEYFQTEGKGANKELSSTTISGVKDQAANLKNLISKLNNQIVVEPYQSFSLLNAINPKTINQVNSDAANILATAVYRAILPTNFLIVERNISSKLPAYSEIGYEAKVNNKMDLVFNNPNPFPYRLSIVLKEDQLQVKLMGVPFPYKYEIRTEVQKFPPKTILQFSALLRPNESKTMEQGDFGYLAKVFRDTKDKNNQVVETVSISEDFYPPVHRVEVTGLTDPQTNEQGGTNSVENFDSTDSDNQINTEDESVNNDESSKTNENNDVDEGNDEDSGEVLIPI